MFNSHADSTKFLNFLNLGFINKHLYSIFISFYLIISLISLSLEKNENKFIQNLRYSIVDYSILPVNIISSPIIFARKLSKDLNDFSSFRDKNEELLVQNSNLQRLYLNSVKIFEENKSLRNLLNFVQTFRFEYETVDIIGATSNFSKSLVIAKAPNSQIEKGEPVVSQYGLVGRIIEVGKETARVLLITDINSRIPVITSSGQRGIVSGTNSKFLKLIYLDNTYNIAIGDLVKTSSEGDVFPSNIIVGYIASMNKNEILVDPVTHMSNIDFISILLSRKLSPQEWANSLKETLKQEVLPATALPGSSNVLNAAANTNVPDAIQVTPPSPVVDPAKQPVDNIQNKETPLKQLLEGDEEYTAPEEEVQP